jgi:uncharacterized membrane protein YphA (DoxX/SURF4 family)
MTGAYLLLLGIVFLAAALAKFQDRQTFAQTLAKLFADPFAQVASFVIPCLEAILGLCLIAGLAARQSLGAGIFLLLLFTFVLTEMWRRGMKNCGCFGESERESTPAIGIARNLLLVFGGLLALRYGHQFTAIGPDVATTFGKFTVAVGLMLFWCSTLAVWERRRFIFAPQ